MKKSKQRNVEINIDLSVLEKTGLGESPEESKCRN